MKEIAILGALALLVAGGFGLRYTIRRILRTAISDPTWHVTQVFVDGGIEITLENITRYRTHSVTTGPKLVRFVRNDDPRWLEAVSAAKLEAEEQAFRLNLLR